MPQTIRKYWGPLQGRMQLNFNWSVIDHDSTVLISASEYNAQRIRFIAEASITVDGIVPHGPPYDPAGNHGVTFFVTVQWSTPINVVTDITVLDQKPLEIQTYTPPMPNNMGLRMQYQESKKWCWIAVATSINHYYNSASTWTQCAVMTDVGHRLNGYPLNTGACPAQKTVDDNPDLKAALANPYLIAAEYILDDAKWGIDTRYLKTGNIKDPLVTTGNWARDLGPTASLSEITTEVSAGRPVAVDIDWLPGNIGQHVVTIAGVSGDILLLLDPVNGTSVMRFKNFPLTYFGGAKIIGYSFTKR
jgi:hypothetical protein